MANEFYGDTGVRVKLLFEVENAKRFGKATAHEIYAPGAPGPELRANVVDVSNDAGAQLTCQAQMETREVGKDSQRRLAPLCFVDEVAHRAGKRGQALQDFGDVHDGGEHLRPAHAENRHVEALFECGGQARSVHIPGGFTGGKQKRNGWHVRRWTRSVARPQRRRLGGAASFDRNVQLLLLVLELVKTKVNAALREKLLVRTLLAQPALVKDEDAVGVLNRA